MKKYYNAFWDLHYTRDRNYYNETASLRSFEPVSLKGEKDYDVCIIGAGFTGLATAYFLKDSGLKVCILERHEIGWGASGRNGGQIIPGLFSEINEVESKLGYVVAKQLWDYSYHGAKMIFDIIDNHKIDCDLVKNYLVVARGEKEVKNLEEFADILGSKYNYKTTIIDKAAVQHRTGTHYYDSGMQKPDAGHFHPLKYARGLANVLKKSKIDIFEHSAAEAINKVQNRYQVYTAAGVIKADKIVLAGDSYLGSLIPELRKKYVLIRNAIIGTEKLDTEKGVLPANDAICESSDFLHFYRKGADGSFLFGGGDVVKPRLATTDTQEKIIKSLSDNMIRIFPELKGVSIPYYWGGYISVTSSYLPNVSTCDHNMFYANGYSGHGVNNAHSVGKLLADAICEKNEDYKIFDRINNMSFPGQGHWDPYFATIGMWWHQIQSKFS